MRDYAALHEVKIDHLYETFYMLILGICGFIRTHRDADDEVLKDLIAQTLHMERGTNVPARTTAAQDGAACGGAAAGAAGPNGSGKELRA